jgi:hypothetical protein
MDSYEEKESQRDQRIEHVSTAASIRSSEGDGAASGTKFSAADAAEAEQIAAQWRDGTLQEKKLVRKLDWRILPCTWVLYLLGYLDRANVRYGKDIDSNFTFTEFCIAMLKQVDWRTTLVSPLHSTPSLFLCFLYPILYLKCRSICY